ncbi:FAD binding domain-containing protein [Massilia sp. PAMC28688]|uniref:FAD binding domain-containing protein n=1 Tax=Massilia sp. PAMC28688 TaxID=2861283 RepID=UPI001C6385D2|nr:FAD binding domain-containing protein [Massilia sp. PAMC28688]QYF94536.1 FAD binding domain-containing protein [Massilia sp. PAMC28688]
MIDFDYSRATHEANALMEASQAGTRILAGGTTLLDLMKCGVEAPRRVIDIARLPDMAGIEVGVASIRIGALATMAQCSEHAGLRAAAPAVTQALALAASPQIRNMATLGGNLLQRTRCSYFRDPQAYSACNKRKPGSGCAALAGVNRDHAILGTSASCIAAYPGDLAVALMAFGARLHIAGKVARVADVDGFYRLPRNRPDLETELAPGEIITAIELPVSAALRRSHYLKVRDRASFQFAAASAAVGLELANDQTVRAVRVALGGVATRPWRAMPVEEALTGKLFTEANVRAAAERAVDGARAHAHNRYKLALTPRVVARALMEAGGLA